MGQRHGHAMRQRREAVNVGAELHVTAGRGAAASREVFRRECMKGAAASIPSHKGERGPALHRHSGAPQASPTRRAAPQAWKPRTTNVAERDGTLTTSFCHAGGSGFRALAPLAPE